MEYYSFSGDNMTPNCKKALQAATNLAVSIGDQSIGTEYLLYGLASVSGSVATKLLNEVGTCCSVMESGRS